MSARSSAKKQLPATRDGVDENPGAAAKVLSTIIERSARVQAPAVKAYVDRLRQQSPDATPAEIVTRLEKHYLAAVMASGAAVGSAAAFPGSARWRPCRLSPARRSFSSRRRRSTCWPSPRCTASPPIIESADGPWSWRCWSARTASARWPICSAPAARAGRGLPTGGDVAAARGLTAELEAAEVLHQALHAQARSDRIR